MNTPEQNGALQIARDAAQARQLAVTRTIELRQVQDELGAARREVQATRDALAVADAALTVALAEITSLAGLLRDVRQRIQPSLIEE